MPITGQETVLKASLISTITAALEAQYGGLIGSPNYIPALSEGIANAIIPFLVTNTTVNPGQTVTTPEGEGTVDSPGTIS